MLNTTSTAATTAADSKNAILDRIREKMGIDPYYGTLEILDEALIQKESWGGKRIPENVVHLSSPANVEYQLFAAIAKVEKDKPFSYYQEIYEAFLKSSKPELTQKEKNFLALKHLVALRSAFLDERKAMEARIRGKAKHLDDYYPIAGAAKIKSLEKFRKENEPLVDELVDEFSWKNLIGYATAGMGYTQKTIIESQILALIENFPAWTKFGDFIPGFGAWTCAFLLTKIAHDPETGKYNPMRFPDSGKVRAYAGVAPIDGKPMRAKRGETLGYDPHMKAMLLNIFPDSFRKIAGKFPDEPYAIFLRECFEKQKTKAINATEAYIRECFEKRGEKVLDIINLGYEDREGVNTFLGFKVKTDKSEKQAQAPDAEQKFVKAEDAVEKGGYKHFLNPGHVQQRALREFGTMFISDLYHVMLYFAGENPDISGNPRIMAVFEKAAQGQ